jgi:hypothetical protein
MLNRSIYQRVEPMSEETARARQSRVSRSGGKWEEYVRLFLNEKLAGTGTEVIVGKNEDSVKKTTAMLWKMLSIPVKSSTLADSVWGDIDLVAIKEEIPIAVISCKLSLHGRFTETLFWSLLFRTLTRIKVVLATPDAGRQSTSDKWMSEWGTPQKPTKDRLLAESYLDGVYVENVEAFCKNMRTTEKTAIGGIIRPLTELPEDLVKWAETALKMTYSEKGLKRFY